MALPVMDGPISAWDSPAVIETDRMSMDFEVDEAADSTVAQQNVVGQPKGSSDANKHRTELKNKQATNWVVVRFE
jgi:hypothetical protein